MVRISSGCRACFVMRGPRTTRIEPVIEVVTPLSSRKISLSSGLRGFSQETPRVAFDWLRVSLGGMK